MNWRHWNLILLGAVWGGMATWIWLPRTVPPLAVRAATSDSVSGVAMATGPVSEDAEGIFLLDSATGTLNCSVFNPQAGQFNTVFRRNVHEDLQLSAVKNPRFMLCTGAVNIPQRSAQSIGGCLLYVVESTTRKLGVYAVPLQRNLFDSGRPQTGDLALLYVGSARDGVVPR